MNPLNVDPVTPPPDLRELFDACVELAPDAREAWLAASAPAPATLRLLRAMLAADASSDGVFATPAAAWATQLEPDPDEAESLLGRDIGGFRLVALLGHGGSSVVFRAERDVAGGVQRVALKLLRTGLFSREAQRRFRREQALLAQLSHPNLAHLIDAGISDAGIPYIAMELVDGLSLTEHADRHGVDRDGRLRLLASLARAVDVAHRALVVHRDLKPSNVMVTADGTVKVLDFGIAKMLGDDDETATRQVALTPGYAAPEQYLGGAPTTAIDVFALGAVGAELLVGARLEVDARLPADADAALRERVRTLDAELLTLLRCALAHEPERRYASARHLADDIERYLRDEPIAAHPPTWRYRSGKFVVRHRLALGLGAAVLLALLLGFGVVLRQRELAQQQAARADSLRDFMFEAFAEAEPSVPRAGPATVLDAVRSALAASEDPGRHDPRARLELRLRLAEVLQRQGDLEGARELLEKTVAEAIRQWGRDDPLARDAAELSVRNATARGEFAAARAALDPLLAHAAADVDAARRIALLSHSAVLATRVRERERALRDGADAVAGARRHGDPELLRTTLNDWGIVLLALGALPEAITVYEELLVLNRARFGAAHQKVANVQAALSRAWRRSGDLGRAVEAARAAVAIDRAIYPGDDRHAAVNLNALLMALRAQGDVDGALVAARDALRINRATLGDEHPDTAIALFGVGELETMRGAYAEAVPLLEEALGHNERRFGASHWASAVVRGQLGYARGLGGDPAGAAQLEHGIAALRALPDPDPDQLAAALEKRVRLALHDGDSGAARRWLSELDALGPDAPPTRASWGGRRDTLRGAALLAGAQPRQARIALERAAQAIAAESTVDPLLHVEYGLLLAQALAADGDTPRALAIASGARTRLQALRFVPPRLRALEAVTPR